MKLNGSSWNYSDQFLYVHLCPYLSNGEAGFGGAIENN